MTNELGPPPSQRCSSFATISQTRRQRKAKHGVKFVEQCADGSEDRNNIIMAIIIITDASLAPDIACGQRADSKTSTEINSERQQ